MITSFNQDVLIARLKEILETTSNDLNQLCKAFFEASLETSSTDLVQLELKFLQDKTSSTINSIPDLWKIYLLQLGYSESPNDAFMNTAIVAEAIALFEYNLIFADITGTGSIDGMVLVETSGLLDTFTAADNTNVHGRTPEIGGAWTAYPYSGTTASVKILSNKAQATEDAAGHIVAESSLSDYIYTCNFTTFDSAPAAAASTQGFILNYIDESNYIYLMLAVGNSGTRGIIGYQLVGGVPTATGPHLYTGYNYATEYAVTITKNGNKLNCTVGPFSTPEITVNAALVNATKHGIMYRKLAGYTGTKHDSLEVVAYA